MTVYNFKKYGREFFVFEFDPGASFRYVSVAKKLGEKRLELSFSDDRKQVFKNVRQCEVVSLADLAILPQILEAIQKSIQAEQSLHQVMGNLFVVRPVFQTTRAVEGGAA